MKLKRQHPEWCAQAHGRNDFHESSEYILAWCVPEIRGEGPIDEVDIRTAGRSDVVVSFGPFNGVCPLVTHEEARALGRARTAHADSAEGPEAGRERLLGDVRAHFG